MAKPKRSMKPKNPPKPPAVDSKIPQTPAQTTNDVLNTSIGVGTVERQVKRVPFYVVREQTTTHFSDGSIVTRDAINTCPQF